MDCVSRPGSGALTVRAGDGVRARAGVPARLVLELVDPEVREPRPGERPGGRQARDPGAEDRDADALPAGDGAGEELAGPDPVPAQDVGPDDRAG